MQRLAGATLLVFANKQDLPGALSAEEIRDVSPVVPFVSPRRRKHQSGHALRDFLSYTHSSEIL